ncbi:hypothetical protein PVAP13_9KG146985 [Panicum virgatum]|uniref:Uncharacterized protein n=1 Tax=Panicum virgatum TaxID=38727 RepID=A0A8T0NI27_PANVG|nr:hypothetical protein PVAP13_9KG146985 [Panicum virgatum]
MQRRRAERPGWPGRAGDQWRAKGESRGQRRSTAGPGPLARSRFCPPPPIQAIDAPHAPPPGLKFPRSAALARAHAGSGVHDVRPACLPGRAARNRCPPGSGAPPAG